MKAVEFENLTFPEKALLLYSGGQYLISATEKPHKVHLFSLDSEFVELYYNEESRIIDRISRIEYTSLDKYLSSISIQLSAEGRMNGSL